MIAVEPAVAAHVWVVRNYACTAPPSTADVAAEPAAEVRKGSSHVPFPICLSISAIPVLSRAVGTRPWQKAISASPHLDGTLCHHFACHRTANPPRTTLPSFTAPVDWPSAASTATRPPSRGGHLPSRPRPTSLLRNGDPPAIYAGKLRGGRGWKARSCRLDGAWVSSLEAPSLHVPSTCARHTSL